MPITATGMIPASTASRVPVLRVSVERMVWPRSSTPTVAPTVATATIITVAWRIPPRTTGTASGSSTFKSTCIGLIPMPRADSTTAGSTVLMPARVFRATGSSP